MKMVTEKNHIDVPWGFIEQHILAPGNEKLARELRHGWFTIPCGLERTLTGIDTENKRALTLEPGEYGPGMYSISSLARNSASALHIEEDATSLELQSAIDTYMELVEQSRAARDQQEVRLRAESEQRAISKQKREDKKLRTKREQIQERERQEAERLATIEGLQGSFQAARDSFIERTLGFLGVDLIEVITPQLDWNEILADPDNKRFGGISVSGAEEHIHEIRVFKGQSRGQFLTPCSALRHLFEPQAVVVIGDALCKQNYFEIVPTYAAALLDLGFNPEAFDACRPLWDEIESEHEPEILTRVFHRACIQTGNSEMQKEIAEFAKGKFDLRGPRTPFPDYLRKERRERLRSLGRN